VYEWEWKWEWEWVRGWVWEERRGEGKDHAMKLFKDEEPMMYCIYRTAAWPRGDDISTRGTGDSAYTPTARTC